EISQILTEAYKNGEKETIEKILEDLVNDVAFGVDWELETNSDKLKKILKRMLQEKQVIQLEISRLKESNMAAVYDGELSLEEYIDEMRIKLETDIVILENKLKTEEA